jgi:hypothetical protein
MLRSHASFAAGWWRAALCLVSALLASCNALPAARPLTLVPTVVLPRSTPTPVPTITFLPLTSFSTSPGKVGIHLLLDDGRNVWPTSLWLTHLRYARDLVGKWGYAAELIRSDDLDPIRWQIFMDECARLHLIPILRLATTFDQTHGWWTSPAADSSGSYDSIAAQYARFIATLRWPRAPHYVIVGNEPNHGDEWGGQADPQAYARFLIDVSRALHQADPLVKVLNAPLDPFTPNTNGQPFINGMTYLDAETFLDQMHTAYPDVFSVIDIWASHAYPLGPLTEGPWRQAFQIDLLNGAHNPVHLQPPSGIYNRGVNGYEWELFKLAAYGVYSLPVMITETGYRHHESVDAQALDNGRAWPEASTVAQFMELAFHGNHGRYPLWPENGWIPWCDDPRVIAVMPFALNGAPHEWGHTTWLQLDLDGAVQGVYPMYNVRPNCVTDKQP